MFKIWGNLKNRIFSNFLAKKGLNKSKKHKNRSKPPNIVSQSPFKQFRHKLSFFSIFTENPYPGDDT